MLKSAGLFVYITIVLLMFIGGKVYTIHETTLLQQRATEFEVETRTFMNKGDRFTGQQGRDLEARIKKLEDTCLKP